METENRGTVLCVSDAAYLRENEEKELPPDSPNREVAQGFLKHFKVLQKHREQTGAVTLYGHDLKQEEQWIKEDESNR